MASLDYSKWDSLNEESDEEDQSKQPVPTPVRRDDGELKVIQQTPKGTEKGRHAFIHNGATICKLMFYEIYFSEFRMFLIQN